MSWMLGWATGSSSRARDAAASEATAAAYVDRMVSSTQPLTFDEKRRAIMELKELAQIRETHETIGRAIMTLIRILRDERKDIELTRAIIELLTLIIKPHEDNSTNTKSYIELVNTETLVQSYNNVTILLNTLEETDFYVRYPTILLLRTLLSNGKLLQVQESILASPMAVSRLMELLADEREPIRNEAILLLIDLTVNNQEIQKIVAFERAFENVFEIIAKEGMNEGSIVVCDCLNLIINLIKGNVSNQNYFRETGCIQCLPVLLELQASDMWLLTDNKRAILLLTLQIVSLLVSGANPSVASNQAMLSQHQVLQRVTSLALGRISEPQIRSQAMRTLGNLLRNHTNNRNLFASLAISLDSLELPEVRPITDKSYQNSLMRLIVINLHSADFSERAAAAYAFQCYLYDNSEGQIALASTLAPHPDDTDEAEPLSVGRHLILALFGWENNKDYLRTWYSACILSYIIYDNQVCKDFVLRLPLEIPVVGGPTSTTMLPKIIESLMVAVKNGSPSIVRVGLLRLICVWIDNCSSAIKAVLQNPNYLPFFVDLVIQPQYDIHVQGLCALVVGLCYEFTEDEVSKSSLNSILTHRIGNDKYIEKLETLRKSVPFLNAEQDTLPSYDGLMDYGDEKLEMLYYDYDFTLFFKDAYDSIVRLIKAPFGKTPKPTHGRRESTSTSNGKPKKKEENDSKKDKEIEELKKQVDSLKLELEKAKAIIAQPPPPPPKPAVDEEEYHKLKQHAHLLEENLKIRDIELDEHKRDQLALAQAYNTLEEKYYAQEKALQSKEAEISSSRSSPPTSVASASAPTDSTAMIQLKGELERLRSENTQLTTINGQLKNMNQQLQSSLTQFKNSATQLQTMATQLRTTNANLMMQNDQLQKERAANAAGGSAAIQLEVLDLKKQIKALEEKNKVLVQDQEDLTVMFAQKDMECNQLREKLRSLGVEI